MENSSEIKKRNNLLFPIIVIVVIVLLAVFFIIKGSHSSKQAVTSASQSTVTQAAPLTSQILNKTYKFPIKDSTGKEIGQLSYELQSVETRNTILVKGEPATATAGNTFLIVNLKITNPTDQDINMNTRDYVRASIDGKKVTDNSKEWLAPDIHNDPVEVQAISTKYTRVGYSLATTSIDKVVLQVGEVTGKKDYITLHLH